MSFSSSKGLGSPLLGSPSRSDALFAPNHQIINPRQSVPGSAHQRMSILSTVSNQSFENPLKERSRLSRSSRTSSDPRPRARSLVGRRRLSQSGSVSGDEYVHAVVPRTEDTDSDYDEEDNEPTPRNPPHKRSACSAKTIFGLFPPLLWLPKYRLKMIFPDIVAGITVGCMCIPQGFAYGTLSKLEPVMGMYTCMVPAFVYILLGTSAQLHVGATSLSSIVAAELMLKAMNGPAPDKESLPDDYAEYQEEYTQHMMNLTFLCGIFYFLAGILRAGTLTNFISHTVLSAFMSGLAVTLSTSQLQNFLGLTTSSEDKVYRSWIVIAEQIAKGSVNWQPFLFGLICLVFLLACKYIPYPPFKWIGGMAQLVVLVVGILVGWLSDGKSDLKSIGEIPNGFPSPINPVAGLDYNRFVLLVPSAITLCVAMFLESHPVAMRLASKHETDVNPDQELRALGITHLVSSVFQCYPHCGSATRSTVMDSCGGKSQIASLISVITVAIALSFLTSVFKYIPKCVLAAILMATCVTLFDFKEFIFLFKAKPRDALVWILTFLSAIVFGVSMSLAVGAICSLMSLSYRNMRPHTRVIGCIPGTTVYQDMKEFYAPEPLPHTIILGFEDSLSYLNSAFLKWKLEDVELRWLEKPPLRFVVLDMSSVPAVDSDGIHTIEELLAQYKKRGIIFVLTGCRKHAKKVLKRALGPRWDGMAFQDIPDAVEAIVEIAEEQSRIVEETIEMTKNLEAHEDA